MSKRRVILDLPVSVFQQLTELAKAKNQSIEAVAAQTLAINLPPTQKKIWQRDEVLAIIAAHREELQSMGVKSLELFGSVARNEANADSDVDFLVEFDRPVGFKFFQVQYFLEDLLGCPVDLGSRKALKEHLREPVLEDVIHAF
ncbi:MAG: nucleotidyltransferase family protein [Gomphosphaeria aponina SAG 52.96 = DSM 107014]|uniref:Nucleotidyltransferase family protein n=1 Tax=Gomphosphaeria aponina SAG 52.96 = DSM 107014 TaxID=1521640 RepID=A0A941JUQ1_9CHRO|nr:nucleotidyltransferase family protein [Gomphosphaeria aponina SAG 52.96 = DSM 107014]